MIDLVIDIAVEAGEKILEFYNSGELQVEIKADNSPVTEADLASNEIITNRLSQEFSFPILSEEAVADYSERKDWGTLWIVDPLDGTKSFVKRTHEFSVNIALVKDGRPVLGVIHLPAENNTYFAEEGKGAFKISNGERIQISNSRTDGSLIGIASRSHLTERDKEFFDKNGIEEVLRSGGSAKFCRVAEGNADIYSRFGPTSEWDVAPGEIILYEAGCKMVQAESGEPLEYNKENPRNPSFIACRSNIEFKL